MTEGLDRAALRARLAEAAEPYDVVVIGGGATGVGAALDAAARGYRTVLFEAGDFACGTSSRSTKLIHGGVRYLARGDLKLVREALHERGLLLRNAPHLVQPQGFVMPVRNRLAQLYYGAGLRAYDWLAGHQRLGRSRLLSRRRTLAALPSLKPAVCGGGIHYQDGRFDDARLALMLARTAVEHGARVLNYAPVRGLEKDGAGCWGVRVEDLEEGASFSVRARAVINAAGVGCDAVRRLADPGARPLVRASRGAHIVVDRSFQPAPDALLIPRTDDGRVLFAIPWLGKVLVGTTDVPVADPGEEPVPSDGEIDYLLDYLGRYLARAPERGDVCSAFAGLRPLVAPPDGANTAALSRDHLVETSMSGLVTVTGGKWTTYRRMAADAVAQAAAAGGLPPVPCPTGTLRLHGWSDDTVLQASAYGSDTPAVREIAAMDSALDRPLHPRLPYRWSEVVWGVREEMARTVEDVLARRTRALLLDARAASACAPAVAAVMARLLGRDQAWANTQAATFQQLAQRCLPSE